MVTATNLDTGVAHKQTSNNTGEFALSGLPIGRYSVLIESAGFENYSVPKIELSQGDRTRVDAVLVVGAALNVEVGTAEPQLQTDKFRGGRRRDGPPGRRPAAGWSQLHAACADPCRDE